jgi:hypothetical protein
MQVAHRRRCGRGGETGYLALPNTMKNACMIGSD